MARGEDWRHGTRRPVYRYEPGPTGELAVIYDEPALLEHVEVRLVGSRTILSRNESPDLDFRWSLNPYRGCAHGCLYCYARITHRYLDRGCGAEFATRIEAKGDAATLLDRALRRPSWPGEPILLSGATDPYQPAEGYLRITRAVLEVLLRHRNPVVIVTKSALVERDRDLLAELARTAGAAVYLSVPCLDDEAAVLEPGAPPPRRRLETMARLAEAGVPVGVSLAPYVPTIGERTWAPVLATAATAGARWCFTTLLRLPSPVDTYFFTELARRWSPARIRRLEARLRDMRGGALDAPASERFRGSGPVWEAAMRLYERLVARYGFNRHPPLFATTRGARSRQPRLPFEG